MKTKEIMTESVGVTLTKRIALAASIMFEAECGIVPVVTDNGRVLGLVTDREVCMATNLQDLTLANIAFEDIITFWPS